MIVRLIAVGRPRGPIARAIAEYEERAGRYWRLRTEEVPSGVRRGGLAAPDEVRQKEGERIRAKVPRAGAVIALTRAGKGLTSEGLARFLEHRAVGSEDVAFIIGGAHGLAVEVLERATLRLALSPMTLPHDLARLLLVEQLYRAGTIRRGEPYHKGGA